VVGVPRKCLEAKARTLASRDEWAPFIDVLALLIFRVVLFPNVDGLVDLAAIDAFLTFHDRKKSPVIAILADLYDTFDQRCEKNSARIVCCTPALYVWLVSHLFRQEERHVFPLEGHHSCPEKKEANWDRLLASKEGAFIEERLRVVEGFGDYPFADMTDLCLVPDIVIPPKFKVPDFDRYKGTTCPKNHLKMYCRKMGAYSRDEKLLMHFFQDSLVGAAVIWYTNLEASRIRTWKDLIMAFLR